MPLRELVLRQELVERSHSTIFQNEFLTTTSSPRNVQRSQPRTLEALSVDRSAAECPLGDSTLSGDEVAVALVADVGYAREAGPQTLRYRLLPLEPPTPRILTARCFEDAVLGEEGHDRVEIVPVEAVQHPLEDGFLVLSVLI